MKRFTKRSGRAVLRLAVERILRSTKPTDTRKADAQIDAMIAKAPPWDESRYAYDDLSVWNRANERTSKLLTLPGMGVPGKRVVEAGCGDGMVGKQLATFGHDVTLVDMEDWRHERCRDLKFVASPLEQELPLPKASFDLVFSYNTFEHVNDPRMALGRLAELLAPGGMVFLEFGPLINSAMGLHAYRAVPILYCQFLFDEALLMEKIKEIGIRDLGTVRTELQPMNRWWARQFAELWQTCGLKVQTAERLPRYIGLTNILRFPQSFRGRGLSWDEVTTAGWRVCLVKPE